MEREGKRTAVHGGLLYRRIPLAVDEASRFTHVRCDGSELDLADGLPESPALDLGDLELERSRLA